VYTMSTGSGAGGGSFAKGRSDAAICVMLWIVAGEECKGGSPSSGVGRSGAEAGAGGWRAGGSIASTRGIGVTRTSCCGVLLALLGALLGAGCSSRSSSWEQSQLTCSSLSMTRRNSGVPQLFAVRSLSSILCVGGLASGRPRSLWNLANPTRNLLKSAWNVLNSCSRFKLGAVSLGCGGLLASSTSMSTTAALGSKGEILVGFPHRIFAASSWLLH